jgi:hypothetical protein
MGARHGGRIAARTVGTITLLASIVALASSASGAEPGAGVAFGPYQTISSALGGRSGVQAGMDTAGETVLAWSSSVGPVRNVQSATIAPGAPSAGATTTLSAGLPTSDPALAVDSTGRVAVAWFQLRHSEREEGDEALALDVRDRSSTGAWEATHVAWHPARRAGYSYGRIAVALDSAGDEAVMWLTSRPGASASEMMVSTRKAGGAFTAPVTLRSDSEEVPPALAMSPGGEVTVLWTDHDDLQLLASSWVAGDLPGSPAVLEQCSAAEPAAKYEGLGDLRLIADSSGDELAVWVFGRGTPAGRPHPVALRAAWRLQGSGFGPTQTVSAPGVDARDPAVVLDPAHGALIAWDEITSDGSGPLLTYASAPVSASFQQGTAILSPVGEVPSLALDWLADGSALIWWPAEERVYAARWIPGQTLGTPAAIDSSEASNSVAMAAGGASEPVIAWVGDPTYEATAEQVHYVIASRLDGSVNSAPVSDLRLLSAERLLRKGNVVIVARCAENCRLTASSRLVILVKRTEAGEGEIYRDIGSFPTLRRNLSAGRSERLKIDLTQRLRRLYVHQCHDMAIEVRLSVMGTAGGVTRRVALAREIGENPCQGVI